MLQLSLRTLRYRTSMFVAAFLALFFAAAIMMASGGLIETGIRTAVPPQQLVSADVVVAGNQKYLDSGGDADEPPILPERVRLDAELADILAALPGVQSLDSFTFEKGAPAGMVDAFAVKAEPGIDVDDLQDRIGAQLDSTAVSLVGDERGRAELREAAGSGVTVMALAGVFTVFVILVSIFGVASMLALSITQRQQDLALLRAVGAASRQLRRSILLETLVLSLLATGLAYFPGQYLGRFIFDRLQEQGIAAEGLAFQQGWIPTVAAMAVAILAAVASALSASRRISRIRPAQALSEVQVDDRPIRGGTLILAVVFLAGGIALTIVTATLMSGPLMAATAAPAVILLAIGSALLAPVLTKATTFAVQWPVRALGGVTGQLAVLNARGRSTRMAAVTGPVILLTAVSTGMLYLQVTNDVADRKSFTDTLTADAVITRQDRFDSDVVGQISNLPGVMGASEYVDSVGFIEDPDDASPSNEGWTLQGVSAEGAATMAPVEVTAGDLSDLQGTTIALENQHAEKLGIGLGDMITVRMGDNTSVELQVGALFSAPENYNTLLLPADTLAAHTTDGFATRILVKFDGDADPEQLKRDLTKATSAMSGVSVTGSEVLFEEFDDQKGTANFAIYIMVLMIAGYAAITMINTLASNMMARRREFGMQRLAGSTRGQVLGMVSLEAAILAVSGLALGTLAAAVVLVPVNLKRLASVLPAGSPWIYLLTVALTISLTLVAMVLPAWRAMRGRPAQAALAIE